MKTSRILFLALIAALLLVPRVSDAQERFRRLNLRVMAGIALPTGPFSQDDPVGGGYAGPGMNYQIGASYRVLRGLTIVGEVVISAFPVNDTATVLWVPPPLPDANWDIRGYVISFRTDFAEAESARVYMQIGFGNYFGDPGVPAGPLYSSDGGDSQASLSAGMGTMINFGRITLELGARLHLPTLRYDDIFDREVQWLSLEAGLLFGIF